MKKKWWKIVTVLLLSYTVLAGLLGYVPRRAILNESIRNLYFHVPMWFGMIILWAISVGKGIKYLRNGVVKNDIESVEIAKISLLMGIIGAITGSVWANFTWGDPWPNDPKLNGVAIGMLEFCAYFVLRGSFDDTQRRGRISAVYNIFAYATFIPLIFIIPRLNDSLHPGNGGNPAFGQYDLDNRMRMVFYPAVIGWTLLGYWMATLAIRLRNVEEQLAEP